MRQGGVRPGGRAGTGWLLALGALVSIAAQAAPAPVDLGPHLRRQGFGDVSLSPTGEYYAVTVAQPDSTALVTMRRADRERTNAMSMGPGAHVTGATWVDEHRLLVSVSERFGALESPVPTGELFLVDARGGKAELLIGIRADPTGISPGTNVAVSGGAAGTLVAAYLLDPLVDDDEHVLVETWPLVEMPNTRVRQMNLDTGVLTTVAIGPVPRATYATDNAGRVRFARGAAADNVSKLYYRADDDSEWQLINDEAVTGVREFPLGFAADDRTAWLQVEAKQGTDAVVAFDTAAGTRRPLLRDAENDPWHVLHAADRGRAAVGVLIGSSPPRAEFFEPDGAQARLYRGLAASFGTDPVRIASVTDDGGLALIESWSARNPGDFFLLDTVAKKAERVLSRREWIQPAATAEVQAVRIPARDGVGLDALLTRPRGASGPLPLVVMPHGGPFGVFDGWEYDDDAQLLAQAGYAVLQVNFRGSGNRGRAFMHAGARQWGRKMQDDVTDATRWAIAQGHVDDGKVCPVGASYGAYAAMVGLAREPELYRCGVGYVGVYDLERMLRDDVRDGRSSANWTREWVGEAGTLAPFSATTLAPQIKAPVLLVAGGKDRIAPIAHSKAMERALERAGVPVETLYASTEGHGFYAEDNRREYYTKLLDFLARHLGGARAQ